MECLLEEYLQIKVKGLPKVDGPRTAQIVLNIVFLIDSMPLAKIDICTNGNLIKETDYTNSSLISSFLLQFSRKTVLEGNSG